MPYEAEYFDQFESIHISNIFRLSNVGTRPGDLLIKQASVVKTCALYCLVLKCNFSHALIPSLFRLEALSHCNICYSNIVSSKTFGKELLQESRCAHPLP